MTTPGDSMTGRDYEREMGGLQATVGAIGTSLAEMSRKMDVIAESVGAVHAEVKTFTGYQHERNHALSNGIDAARGEMARHAHESKSRADKLHDRLDEHDARLGVLETAKITERAFVAGVSAAVSAVIAAVSWWFTHGAR